MHSIDRHEPSLIAGKKDIINLVYGDYILHSRSLIIYVILSLIIYKYTSIWYLKIQQFELFLQTPITKWPRMSFNEL